MVDYHNDDTVWKKRQDFEDAVYAKARELFQAARERSGNDNNMGYNPLDDEDRAPKREEIKEGLKWLDDMLEDFLKPDPEVFEPLIEDTAKVRDLFGVEGADHNEFMPGGVGDLNDLNLAMTEIKTWRGAFSDSLASDFLMPMGDVTGNHGLIAKVLNLNVIAMQAAYIHVRNQTMDTLDKGITAIEAISDSKGITLDMILGILTSAVSMAVPLLPSTKGIQLGAAALTTALGYGKDAATEEKEEEPVPLGADTIPEVVDNVKKAMEKVKENRTTDEDNIIKACTDSEDAIQKRFEMDDDAPNPVFPPRPSIQGHPNPSSGLKPPGSS